MKSPRPYFIGGCVSLFFMALLWSVDDSLIYFFLGLGSFLLFLAYYFKPQNVRFESSARDRRSSSQTGTFESFFRKQNKQSQSSGNINPSSKAIMSFIFIGGMIIFFIVIISLFASGDDYIQFEDFSKAEQFRLNSQLDSAKIYYRRALREDPEYTETLIGMGNTFMSEENYDSSRYYFDKSMDIDPESTEARYGIALTYYYQKDYRSSLRETLWLVKSYPEYTDGVVLTGDNYYMQERYDSAMYYYELEYGRGTKTPGLSHVMAYIYDTKGQQEKAINLYKEALSMDSTRVDIYDRLAELEPAQANSYKAQGKKWRDAGYGN